MRTLYGGSCMDDSSEFDAISSTAETGQICHRIELAVSFY